MIYIVASICFIAGFFCAAFLRPGEHHDECEERYERMRANLAAQVDARDAEIDKLLKGQS